MILNVAERLVLLNLLPKQGTLADFRILQDLKRDLGLTEEEFQKLNVKQENGMLYWDGESPVEIDLSGRAGKIITETLVEIDKQGGVTQENFSLFEKFEIGKEK